MSDSEAYRDLFETLAHDEPLELPPARDATEIAAMLATALDVAEIGVHAEQDPASRHVVWLYASGAIYRLDVRAIARPRRATT